MSIPNNWGDWRPNLTPHTGDLQATDLIECTMIVGGVPVNTAITGQQIIDAASGGGAAGYYAMYQDNITQTAAVINTGYPIKFRTLDYSNGVSVVSDSRITIANTGIYNLQFSVQLENSSTQEHDVTIWLRKNGVDVTGSSGFVSVASSHGGVHGHILPAWNYLLDAIGGDYYELVWSVSSTAVTMPYYPGALPPPSAASAIFTVTQQSGIIAGTGMTALNGLSGAVQTISTGTTGTDFNVVSSGTDHKFNIPTASATNRGALSNTDWSTFNAKQPTLVSGTNIKTINSTSLLGSGDIVIGGGGLTVGTTAIASGTIGGILFQNGSNLLAQDPALFWDNTNKRLGVGATPASTVRLDVRAQGALSTDIAFRVRNSANTRNIISVQGDETITLGATTNANTKLSISGSSIGVSSIATRVAFSAIINPATSINTGAFDGFVRVSGGAPSGNYYGLSTDIDSGNANTNLYAVFATSHGSGTNYGGYFRAYGGTSNHALYVLDGDMRFGATTTNKIGFWNRTPILQPTTAVAAATFVVGVGTAVTDASTFDGYTLGQIARALRNMGILA